MRSFTSVLNKINKNIKHIANKTTKKSKLTEKHKKQLEKIMIKLYTASNDLEKIAILID